jgi:hypothetical protein
MLIGAKLLLMGGIAAVAAAGPGNTDNTDYGRDDQVVAAQQSSASQAIEVRGNVLPADLACENHCNVWQLMGHMP